MGQGIVSLLVATASVGLVQVTVSVNAEKADWLGSRIRFTPVGFLRQANNQVACVSGVKGRRPGKGFGRSSRHEGAACSSRSEADFSLWGSGLGRSRLRRLTDKNLGASGGHERTVGSGSQGRRLSGQGIRTGPLT